MKRKYINSFLGAVLASLLLVSCSKILDEQPRSSYVPSFFKTEQGVQSGLTSLYAHLRLFYGSGYYYNAGVTGTDEATYAQSADDNFKTHDMSGVGEVTPDRNNSDALWNAAFPNINTASGIIENAADAGISDDLIAEARFFRAWDYFMLVQTFGGVPLDLGSGELMFNQSTIRSSVRNTVPEVYTKAIFPDLLLAVEHLNDGGRDGYTGTASKTLARLYLAKAYLTYGWWLENPNNIPTYPETARVDPDGHDAQWYFQQAYNVATEAIANPGPYSLQSTYYDVHLGSNDRNSEILLYADHTEESEIYNDASLTYSGGGGRDNFAVWMMTWNYTNIRSSGASTVKREADQHLGRPWTRMCPTIGAITNTFADKTYDSRYDGTFTTVYRGNWPKGGDNTGSYANANGLPVYPGDAIFTFLDEEPATTITYPDGKGDSNIGAGELPGRADYVVSPSGISRVVYPGLWKMGVYRTDNGAGLGQPNAASTRPYNIAKFSELYFIAAEAAVKGATGSQSARDLINIIRARAGKWRFDNNGNVDKNVDYSAEMVAATPATIDVDYILAERSREYFAEGFRWFDLVRTQTWAEKAGTYQICGRDYGDHTPQTIQRTIRPYHYLRPIPRGQIDGLEMEEMELELYQNPGYE